MREKTEKSTTAWRRKQNPDSIVTGVTFIAHSNLKARFGIAATVDFVEDGGNTRSITEETFRDIFEPCPPLEDLTIIDPDVDSVAHVLADWKLSKLARDAIGGPLDPRTESRIRLTL